MNENTGEDALALAQAAAMLAAATIERLAAIGKFQADDVNFAFGHALNGGVGSDDKLRNKFLDERRKHALAAIKG